GRDQSGPRKMLADFRGIIQTDGFTVYDSLYRNHPDIHLTFCMAHARRKFVDAVKDDEKQANYVLDEIQKLYLLEAKMRDGAMDWQQRTALRKEHTEPVLENLGRWLEEKQYGYRPKSPMGQAIAYADKRWVGLSAFVLHGQGLIFLLHLVTSFLFKDPCRDPVYLILAGHKTHKKAIDNCFITHSIRQMLLYRSFAKGFGNQVLK